MIDIAAEHLVSIARASAHLPPRSTGRAVHATTVYRWCTRGVGGVILESIAIGGCTYTSREAIQRFAERLTSRRRHRPAADPPGPGRGERAARLVEHRLRLHAPPRAPRRARATPPAP